MSVVISPPTTTRPVVISVSQATRPVGSSRSTASSTASEIWSAILSGWPSVTDSEVKRNSRPTGLLDLKEEGELAHVAVPRRPGRERLERPQVVRDLPRRLDAAELDEALEQRDRVLQVDVDEAVRLVRQARGLLRVLEGRVVLQLRAAALEIGDATLGIGEDDLAVDGAVEERDVPEVQLLERRARDPCRPRMQRQAEALRQLGDELVDRRDAPARAVGLRHERHLGNERPARADVDRVLVREERGEPLEEPQERERLRRQRPRAGAERLLELRLHLPAAVERGVEERPGRHLAEELRFVRLRLLLAA